MDKKTVDLLERMREQLATGIEEQAPDLWKLNNALTALRRGIRKLPNHVDRKDLEMAEKILAGYVKGHSK